MDNSLASLLHQLVFELDKGADKLLQTHVGISYKRALFLVVLHECGTVTQHELASALGYSDPAVSMMLLELSKGGYITTKKSPEHARKRLVTLTPEGSELVAQGTHLLDVHFEQLMQDASVDAKLYRELTERVYHALVTKRKKEQS